MKQLSGNDVTWYQPCTKEHTKEWKYGKELAVFKGTPWDSVSISCGDKDITCCSHNGHKQGNEEGLQDFVFELYQEEVTIKSKFCWPELESIRSSFLEESGILINAASKDIWDQNKN